LLYIKGGLLFYIVQNMPPHTAARIQQLCSDAICAKTEAEIQRIIPELKAALQEHVRLAKESLQAQASAVSALENVAPHLRSSA
jgi:F0F1-type ATP synthase membrane subunit b/b'